VKDATPQALADLDKNVGGAVASGGAGGTGLSDVEANFQWGTQQDPFVSPIAPPLPGTAPAPPPPPAEKK
jgi:hypothetical protein